MFAVSLHVLETLSTDNRKIVSSASFGKEMNIVRRLRNNSDFTIIVQGVDS